jgi:adenine-specific DNA-methyltransferase
MPLLDWLNKDSATKAAAKSAYRLLEEIPELSYGDKDSENLIIQGDNLEALKALLPFYAGKVKCIFIDPPYNTKSAFEHYDDNLEHSKWLSLMYPRLELLRELLSEDGSIWVTIDDHECHYLKIIMDEIFGRSSFVASFAWEKDKGRRNDTDVSSAHDHVLLYVKNREAWKKIRNPLPRTDAQVSRYKNPDGDPRGPWLQGDNGTAKSGSESARFSITLPSGRVVTPPQGNFWRFSVENFNNALAENRVYFGKKGDGLPIIKRYLSEVQEGVVPRTWWTAEEAGSNQSAKRDHLRKLLPEIEPFSTPKPEELLKLILHISTNTGDLVLDSFLGSGTTSAAAQKMGRRWIGIEMGNHAITHCHPRLKKVIDGEQGGISKAVNWQGGGGFRFCKLGPTVFDEFGALNSEIKFATLAAHIWYIETRLPLGQKKRSPLIGVHNGTAYYLLYNGILGDKRPAGGNVLTGNILAMLPPFDGPKVIYGETTRLGEARLKQEDITFKQIPYDVKAL